MTLVLAMLLDAAMGEPRWLWTRLPHPSVLMGNAVGLLDQRYNSGANRRLKGTLCLASLVVAAGLVGWLVHLIPDYGILEGALIAILLAQRSLVDHVRAVAVALRSSLDAGKVQVSKIVGRNTSDMDAPAVSRAAIESAAENFSDGVVAPLFWAVVAGLPGIMIYKMVNTADSMIGYRTERYEAFGWASARTDDVLNLIPARLTAVLFAGLTSTLGEWSTIVRDARNHRSPNAGWPEAAMARALGVALSGPRSYDGRMQDFPFVNAKGLRNPGPTEILASTRILWKAWATILLGIALFSALSA